RQPERRVRHDRVRRCRRVRPDRRRGSEVVCRSRQADAVAGAHVPVVRRAHDRRRRLADGGTCLRTGRTDRMTSPVTPNTRAEALPLADQSVQTTVTSPPYWGQRDYGYGTQSGLESTYVAYLDWWQTV